MAGNGWGEAQKWYDYNRKTQAWNSFTWTSDSTKVVYTVTGYARSGDGSGQWYASDWGCTVTVYYKIGNGGWTSLGSAYAVLNYGDEVGVVTKNLTVNRTHSAQTIQFKTEVTSSYWPTASSVSSDSMAALASYAVSYNANGGSGAPSSQTKWHGEALTLSSTKPTRSASTAATYTVTYNHNYSGSTNTTATAKKTTSYTFKNWNTKADGTGTSYASGGSYTANAATTLYAQWNSSTSTASVTLPTPTRSGYTFGGWYKEAACTNKVGNGGAGYTPTASIMLYAKWTANTFTITPNANGGTLKSGCAALTKQYGVALTLWASSLNPTRTGHNFGGWNTKADGTGTNYQPGASYPAGNNANATLYAKWTAVTYQVTYNGNKPSGASGSVSDVPSAQTKTYGVALTLSSARPTLSGYTFKGWATSSTATAASYQPGGSYTGNAPLALYAVWSLNYVAPKLTKLTAVRTNSSGASQDDGTYCKCTLTWTAGTAPITSVTFKAVNGSNTYTGNGTVSGTTAACTFGGGNLNTELRYTVTATLTDGAGKSYTLTTTLSPSFFTLDFLAGGKGIGVGMAATRAGLDIGMGTYHVAQPVHLVSDNITSGTAPSSTAYGNAYLYFRDSAEALVGFIDPIFYASGTQNIRFYASRRIDSTTYYNGFRIGLTASGDPAVGFHDTACRDAWLDALGIGAIGLKDSLAASDIPDLSASKITSGTLGVDRIPNHSAAKLTSGTVALARGGTNSDNTARAINTVFAGPSSGDAGNASWRKLVAADIPSLNTSKLTAGILGIARGGTGSSQVVSIVNNSTLTIFAWGPLVMVQLHGLELAPGTSTAVSSTAYLASYKPGYNVSALVSGPENNDRIARLWVGKDDGKVYLNAVNTTTKTAWYGTLVYMRA